jgi:hypothetical protein
MQVLPVSTTIPIICHILIIILFEVVSYSTHYVIDKVCIIFNRKSYISRFNPVITVHILILSNLRSDMT